MFLVSLNHYQIMIVFDRQGQGSRRQKDVKGIVMKYVSRISDEGFSIFLLS